MNTQYYCRGEGRRKAVKYPEDHDGNPITPKINGIDYLEVISPNQKTLEVHFLHNLPGQPDAPVPPSPAPELKIENVRIDGGVRIKNVKVDTIQIKNKNILKVVVKEAGDFSTYTLRIVTSPTESKPPDGFDQQLAAVAFSFKANCPSDFDCKSKTLCPEERTPDPKIDYLAKDYASFRRLMLDRMSSIMPDWNERHAADLQVALVELCAYMGDYLSYYQDAVATEAYLGTARHRISARRHARLLDYFAHDGCNARAWVYMEIEEKGSLDNQTLPEGTILMTKGPGDNPIVPSEDLERIIAEQQPGIFETRHEINLHSAHNRIPFYTWNDWNCCLPRGSTRATLLNKPALSLEKGDVIIFEEVCGPAGNEADADPSHRHAVRLKRVEGIHDHVTDTPVMEIEWYEEDALPFPLCLSATVSDDDGVEKVQEISVARGNIVLADYGISLEAQKLDPEAVSGENEYRPRLRHTDITVSVPYEHETARSEAALVTLEQDPRKALPIISLVESEKTWSVQRDLLASNRFATEFVVEIERDGSAQLRFGDGVSGKKPASDFSPSANYRVGTGRNGNVGAKAIGRIVWDNGGIKSLYNPLPARGGRDAETMEEIRQFAPQAFRTQERAVTEVDYADKTQLHPEVQKAAARFRWTGSWYTVFVTVDRKDGRNVDAAFKEEIRRHLEQYRMAGYDLEIIGPVYVPLDIILNVCVKPGYFRSDVKESLRDVFGCYDLPDGTRGFFHPDNFTFGKPVYLSKIYQRAMEIDGVVSLEAKKFQRWAKKAAGEKENGYLQPEELEIIRLDNDSNFPENGKIDFIMYGGI